MQQVVRMQRLTGQQIVEKKYLYIFIIYVLQERKGMCVGGDQGIITSYQILMSIFSHCIYMSRSPQKNKLCITFK